MITSKSLEENGKESLTTSTIVQNGRNKNTFMTTKGKPLTIVALRLLWELGQVYIALPLLLRSHNVFSGRWEISTDARNSKRRQNANRSLGGKKKPSPQTPRSKEQAKERKRCERGEVDKKRFRKPYTRDQRRGEASIQRGVFQVLG